MPSVGSLRRPRRRTELATVIPIRRAGRTGVDRPEPPFGGDAA